MIINQIETNCAFFTFECLLDFPGSFEASFALAFHLRAAIGEATDKTQAKKATTLLLKAAKLDSTRPGPFSLLGVSCEYQKDMSRAKGCYRKALAINPSRPVAGRGLLRLIGLDGATSLCENNAKCNGPTKIEGRR
jgi:hypothetical protein